MQSSAISAIINAILRLLIFGIRNFLRAGIFELAGRRAYITVFVAERVCGLYISLGKSNKFSIIKYFCVSILNAPFINKFAMTIYKRINPYHTTIPALFVSYLEHIHASAISAI